MTDDARVIAHTMLTQALAGRPISRPALVGAQLGLACIWLRERAAKVLCNAVRPRELLDGAVAALEEAHPTPDPESAWQYAAAVEIATAELTGDGSRVDPATVRYLTRDPDGMLASMAELTAHLYRIHDGLGAAAVVRALRP